MNIPIFRAKKIDSDEYTIGELTKLLIPDIEIISEDEEATTERWAYFIVKDISMLDVGCSFNYCSENRFDFKVSEKDEIDPTTLSIHFPDMIDSQGNKIFASLSENGKGGDRLIEDGRYEDGYNPVFEPYFRKSSFSIYDLPTTPSGEYKLKWYKIIGIQR